MITKYNKFNIDESIYTKEDIDKILDKGFLNFDESDFAVLNSYATDDKELKELLKKIKSYKEPFETLNVLIKNETDGIKKQMFFKKWLGLHEELTELENELKSKFKIEDLKKLGNLRESFSFSPNYKYTSIAVAINNKEELDKYKNIIYRFCADNNINSMNIDSFFNGFNWFTSNYTASPIYIRLTSPYVTLNITYGGLDGFESINRKNNHTCEKLFTVEEFQDVLNNIKRFGKGGLIPSYTPKKFDRTLESVEILNEFYSNEEISNTLYFKKYNTFVMVFDKDVNIVKYDIMAKALGKIFNFDNTFYFNVQGYKGNCRDNKFIYKVKKYQNTYSYGWDQEKNFDSSLENCTYPKLFTIDEVDSEDKIRRILLHGGTTPSYKPKKFDRTLERSSLVEGIKYWPYRFKTREEMIKDYGESWEDRIADANPDDGVSVNWSSMMNYLLGQPCEIEDIDMTKNYRYYLPTTLIDRGHWIITNEMLTKNKPIIPDYSPRKFDRTLEDIKYWHYRFKTEEEFIKQYGIDWDRRIHYINIDSNVGVSWSDQMDSLFGQPCEIEGIDMSKNQRYNLPTNLNERGYWIITNEMLTKNKPIIPDYSPKKFDRTLESKNEYEYRYVPIKVEDKDELDILINMLIEISPKLVNRTYFYDMEFPNWIFVDLYKDVNYRTAAKWDTTAHEKDVLNYVNNTDNCYKKIFTINELYLLKRYILTGGDAPSYKPKKFDRTLESKETNRYEYLIFKVETLGDFRKAQQELFNQKYIWITDDTRIKDSSRDEDYPLYIFVIGENVRNYKHRFFYECTSLLEEGNVQRTILRRTEGSSEEQICPKIFTIHDISNVNRLFNYQEAPSYTPKKFDRTLESLQDYPYNEIVIKVDSKEEAEELENKLRTIGKVSYTLSQIIKNFPNYIFIKVYYFNVNKSTSFSYISDYPTDALLNHYIYNAENVNKRIFTLGNWTIIRNILLKGEEMDEPSYKPKKFDRTLEAKENYMYNRVVFKVDNKEQNEIAQKALFNLGYFWSTTRNTVEVFTNYPIYLFTPSTYDYSKDITYMYFCQGDIRNIDSYITKKNQERDNICPTVFNYNNVAQLNTILKNGAIVPSYKPKKFDRSLESFSGFKLNEDIGNRDLLDCAYFKKYNTFFMVFNRDVDRDKYDKLVNLITDTFKLDIENNMKGYRRHCDDEKFFYYITLMGGEFRWGWDNYRDFQNYRDNWYTYLKPLTIDEIYPKSKLEGILQNGEITPSYAPKKFDRTLEAKTWYPYRFKTEEEMIKTLGKDWRYDAFARVGWSDGVSLDMDYFLGREYPYTLDEIEITTNNYSTHFPTVIDIEGKRWQVHRDMLTDNELDVPNYSPKKFDRTLESNSFEQSLIKKIQSVLTPDLLNLEWKKKLETVKHHPHAGHCYAAAEALYHLLGGKEKGYKPMRGKLNDETHWWIIDKNGNILDPTAEQFYYVNLKPPYEKGRGTGFLTKNPSKRAKEIISKIQNI